MAAPTVQQSSATRATRERGITKTLLACGVAYLVLYVVANDVVAAVIFDGYSRRDQAISELSARGAESRGFLVALAPIFTLLLVATGVGIRRAAGGSRSLRLLGAVLVAWGASGLAWLAFPMTSREEMARVGSTGANDAGHLVLTGLTFVFIFSTIALGAVSFGRRFRWYSIASALVILLTGAIVGIQSAGLPDGEATPGMGLVERISAYGMMLYVAVVAIAAWRRLGPRPADQSGTFVPTSRNPGGAR